MFVFITLLNKKSYVQSFESRLQAESSQRCAADSLLKQELNTLRKLLINLINSVLILSVLGFGFGYVKAQGDSEKEAKLQTIPPGPIEYEGSPAYPFGRLNPQAPVETKQLDFLIGEFDCEDRIFSPQNKIVANISLCPKWTFRY